MRPGGRATRRRHHDEESHNKERWLVSYADFITLLFAFFVVMYSISSVNEGKYKVLSETLEGVFNAPRRSIDPVQVGEVIPRSNVEPADVIVQPIQTAPKNLEGREERRSAEMREIADKFAGKFSALIGQGMVSVNENDQWIEVTLRNSLLFGSGDAEPHYDAFPVLESVAKILKGYDHALMVEGFTDNVPVRGPTFPSNWELSAARAASVVRVLASQGVPPSQMAAAGYGEYQPVARNDTAEGRSRNRRVVLLISRDDDIRKVSRPTGPR